ncbi:MAG: hypothetical protein ACI8ZB_004723 [Desulforhopalus sp.]|jgi:hypothetical protein
MNSFQGAPVHTGAALGFSFCCGRGEAAQKTKELDLSKFPTDASYMSGMNGQERNWLPTDAMVEAIIGNVNHLSKIAT